MGGYGYIHLQIDCVYLQNDQTMTWGWGIELDISETMVERETNHRHVWI